MHIPMKDTGGQYKILLVNELKCKGWEQTVDEIHAWANYLTKPEIEQLITEYLLYQ